MKRLLPAALVILIGLATLLPFLSGESRVAEACVDVTDRERTRILALDAVDDAFKLQIAHLFDYWIKDSTDQPKRARAGTQNAITARVRARDYILHWNPQPCSKSP